MPMFSCLSLNSQIVLIVFFFIGFVQRALCQSIEVYKVLFWYYVVKFVYCSILFEKCAIFSLLNNYMLEYRYEPRHVISNTVAF